MLIKDWEYKNFITNIQDYKAILIHGSDRGKVDEKSINICEKIYQVFDKKVEQINFDYDTFLKNKSYFNELIYQRSFFSKSTIIKVNLDLLKIDQGFVSIFENLDSKRSNFILLESKYLIPNNPLLNIFKKTSNFALLPCYQEINIKNSVIKYAKEFSLFLDESSVDYLSTRLGNDSMITKNEIKKLSLFANGKNIDFNILLEAIGDNSVINLFNLCDSIGIEDIDRLNYLYDRASTLGSNYIITLRTLSRHFQLLLLAKSKKIVDAKELKPVIHFSRYEKINKQLQNIKVEKLRQYAKSLHQLEVSCKLNSSINDLLIKKFVFDIISY